MTILIIAMAIREVENGDDEELESAI